MLPAFVAHALDVVAELLAPSLCAECGVPLGSRKLFCAPCGARVDGPVKETVSGLCCIAIGRYEGPLARTVRRFKYDGRSDLAKPLAGAASAAIQSAIDTPALLVPIPLHARRLSERGYDQSVLLASAMGKYLGWRVETDALCRTRLTMQQATLDRAHRFENARGAFRARRALTDRRVVLVDDVVTTLATALECKAVLTDVGADVVAVVAAARRGVA